MSNYIHALDTTNKRVKAINCDSNGNLQVDVVSMTGGGDATAANQVTNHSKLDTLATKLDTLDGSINVIEGCVGSSKVAVSNTGLASLEGAINSSKVDVNIASDGASLATSANQTTAHTKIDAITTALADVSSATKQQTLIVSVGNVETDIDNLAKVAYDDNAAVGSDKGALIMGENPTNKTKAIQVNASGEVKVEIAEHTKGQATMASSFPVVIASNQGALGVTHGAFTAIEGAINSSKMDVNISSDGAGLATSGNQTSMNSNLSSILADTTASKPSRSQVSLASSASITAGGNTSEIDMDGFRHIRIYGSSSVNFGSFCLINRASSGGSDFLDGSNIFSASDPTGGSNYHFSALIENVGARYIAFKNLNSGAQVVTLYAERLR